jgi:hypothetical protein
VLASALILITIAATASPAGVVPDPMRSTCVFPAGPLLACPDPIAIDVTVRDALNNPLPGCDVEVFVVVDSGTLHAAQVLSATGTTNALGFVELVFPDGIRGDATIHFETHVYCAGDVSLCSSPPRTVQCTQPVHITPDTWSNVKALFQ